MIRKFTTLITIAAGVVLIAESASAQHLWWVESHGPKDATCLYGEITVLATHHAIYYCGANWHPGDPAGGYCGIQHNGPSERRTIFSIWDTSPKLHPKVTQADPKTNFSRFGGEGEGAHTDMIWDWQEGETFKFFVEKRAGLLPNTTDARYYIYDSKTKKWLHSATITSPSGDENSRASVATLGGGGLGSFLENFLGKDKDVPKLALYRLWLGSDINNMQCLTKARGDGKWGQLHDAYFLAEGSDKELNVVFDKLKAKYGKPAFGQQNKEMPAISEKPLSEDTKRQLKALPTAARVQNK